MQQAYKYSVLYFLVFSFLLLLSGVLLFEEKLGFSREGVLSYYLGDEERFTQPKSVAGILKIVLPHVFTFGLFVMVILHFLVFTKVKKTKKFQTIVYLSFATAFSELFSPLFIVNGFEFFAYVKIASFFTFEFLILYVSWLLFKSIVYD